MVVFCWLYGVVMVVLYVYMCIYFLFMVCFMVVSS